MVSSPAASPPDVGVVVVAAGAGVRAGPGEPKQFHVMPGCYHNDGIPEEMFTELKTFLAKHAPLE